MKKIKRQKKKKEEDVEEKSRRKEVIDRLDKLIELRNNNIKQIKSVKEPAIEEENLRFELWKVRFDLINYKKELVYKKKDIEKISAEISKLTNLFDLLPLLEERKKLSIKALDIQQEISELTILLNNQKAIFGFQERVVKKLRRQIRASEDMETKERATINSLSEELYA